MKNTNLQIANATIHPGEALSLALPLPELFSCAPLYMPIKVIHGKQSGPTLLVTAAMHGNELNGTEIINRLLELSSLRQLRGTLIAVPVLNVYGLISRARYMPGGIELDRCFPGAQNGTNGARLANLFVKEIFSKADCCIDLQTGSINHSNLPQIYVSFKDNNAKTLAEAFNAPVISDIACEKGMLRTVALKHDKPYLTYEAGEAMRFDEHAIRVGQRGVMNVLKKLGMLPIKPPKKENQLHSFFAERNIWVRASTSGISHSKHKLGQYVKKGEALCVIKDPFGATDSINVYSPEDGIIVGKNNLPLVHEGEALFQIALFSRMKHAVEHLEEWREKSNKRFKQSGTE